MQKIIGVLSYCLLSVSCFSQARNNTDSSQVSKGAKGVEACAEVSPELVIYPNPAKNKITLQVKHFEPGIATVKILDLKGKLVREDQRLITNGSEDIVMFLMLKAGVYFILVSEPGKTVRKKLVVF